MSSRFQHACPLSSGTAQEIFHSSQEGLPLCLKAICHRRDTVRSCDFKGSRGLAMISRKWACLFLTSQPNLVGNTSFWLLSMLWPSCSCSNKRRCVGTLGERGYGVADYCSKNQILRGSRPKQHHSVVYQGWNYNTARASKILICQPTAALGDLSWGITTPKGFKSRRIFLACVGFLLLPGKAAVFIRSAVYAATSGCCDCRLKRSRKACITQDNTLVKRSMPHVHALVVFR